MNLTKYLSRLGGRLGVGLCVLGFLVVFFGWNGAASRNFLPAQFPYLISGGITGLCLVVLGVGMIIVENQRNDRAALQASLAELLEALERAGVASPNGATAVAVGRDQVIAGASSYHRPDCHLIEGRGDAEVISATEAEERGLAPCRLCTPDQQGARARSRR